MKLNKTWHRIYDLIFSFLAIVGAFIAFLDIAKGLSPWQIYLDYFIIFMFTIDYIARFLIAKDKKKFVKNNICDLIAIIPFYTIFRVFKALKIMYLPRIIALMYRPLKKLKRFFNTNGFKYVVFITAAMIIVGGIMMHYVENMSFPDGIWWAFVTATTVGYGDISPNSLYGRLIAMVLMVFGIGLIGTVTSTLTSYFLNKQNAGIKKETIENIKAKLDDFDNLSAADVDDICKILKGLKK